VRKSAIMTAVALALLASPARPIASDHGRKLPTHFEATLVGFQENPSISTTGNGHVDVRIDDDSQTIDYTVTYDELEGVGTTPFVNSGVVLFSHIHVGARGVNGGVSVFFCGGGGKPACPTPSGTVSGTIAAADIVGPAAQGINPGEPTAFEELVNAIRAGFAYANVHTTRWTGGEIRGQLHESHPH
jgi:CHRD domain-containing protein